MGRRSIKEKKNIYQECREAADMTRAEASEAMEFISDSRIEKIESEKSLPHPEEVLAMAKAYKDPSLCNYFCTHECPIGEKYVPEAKNSELSQIILEVLASLNTLERNKDRLIEISADGEISRDEVADFVRIRLALKEIAQAVYSLQLWSDNKVAMGKIDQTLLTQAENLLKKQ